MRIRLFENHDFDACVNTFVDVFNQEPWIDCWIYESARSYLSDFRNTPGFIGVVAADGNEITGFIFGNSKQWWSGTEFFINVMCVLNDRQNNGIGTQLMNYLFKELKLNRINTVTLLTDRGIPAEMFYKKNGFTEVLRLVFLSKHI